MMTRRDPYREITDRMIEALESGDVAPWQRPWKLSPYGSTPRNVVTGRPYRGINVWATLLTAWERGYEMPLWLTFKQANEIAARAMREAGRAVEQNKRGRWVFADGEDKGKSVGGVRAGQNRQNGAGATSVIFWKPVRKTEKDEDGEDQDRSFLVTRVYSVFNIAQCDDHVRDHVCRPDSEVSEFNPIEKCERICEAFEVETRHGGDRAFYNVTEDYIQLPHPGQFQTPEHYYTVRFHEMGHSTGHVARLGRDSMKDANLRKNHVYSEEELVAEFTACFLAGEAGIIRTVETNATAYLRHWAAKLREDKRILVNAAQRAQKAADLILGRHKNGEQEQSQAA